MTRDEKLARISKDLIIKEPFYGLFLIALNKVWDKRIPTACVGKNGINYQLVINEDYWNDIADDYKIGLIKHELLHIGFYHLTDFTHLSDQILANMAMDLEVNQYLAKEQVMKEWLTLDKFPDLKLEVKKGTNYYYDKLKKASPNSPSGKLIQQIRNAFGEGSFKITLPNGQELDLSDHSLWKEFEGRSDAEAKLVKKQIETLLKDIADNVTKSRGTVPGEFAHFLNMGEIEPEKFNWRSYLRRFAGASNLIYTKKLKRKLNKRFEDNPGLRIKKKNHILVAVDTSGSVDNSELVEFFNEIHHIHRTGSEVTVIQCDTAISHKERYNPKAEIKIHGRGGTSFDPVIDYYNDNLREYTCLIYLTDGEAPAPPKARGKMLWVMSSKSNYNDQLIGPQIKLN